MKDFWKNLLVAVLSSAIVGNTVLLLDLRDRVTRVETVLTLKHSTAQK